MKSKIENINQSSSTTSLVITIDDFEIKIADVMDMEILWKDFEITGFIKINDLYDIANLLDINTSTTLTLYVSDLYEEYFSRQFVIKKYDQVSLNNSKFISLELQDTVSYALKNTFVSRGFKNKSITDIFKYCMSLKVDTMLSGFPITKYIDETTIKHPNKVLVTTTNALDFLTKELSKEGYKLFQTRKGIHLKNITDLYPSKLETNEFVYTESSSNQYYGFNIMDFETINSDQSAIEPASTVLAYDPSTKTMKSYSKNLDTMFNDIKSSSSSSSPQVSEGTIIKTQEYLTDNNLAMKTYLSYLNSNGVFVAVPGNVKYNEVFKLYDIILKGDINITESQNEGDVKLSGKYVCTEIVDKIIPGEKFIQKLKLNRVDYTKVS